MDFARFDKRHYTTLPVKEGYTEWARTYDATVAGELDLPLLNKVTSVRWEDIERAADLACGTGRIGQWLREHGVRRIDGIDLTPAMLTRARTRNVYGYLAEGDARDTGLDDAVYGLVTAVLMDEHIPDLAPLYAEVARLLCPGGCFVLIGYHPHFLLSGIPTHFDLESGESIAIEAYVHLLSDHFNAAKAAGLEPVEMREEVIDESWVVHERRWERYLGQPVSFMLVARR